MTYAIPDADNAFGLAVSDQPSVRGLLIHGGGLDP